MRLTITLLFLIAVVACQKTEVATPATPILETLTAKDYMAKFKATANAQMVDVRTLSEYNAGHRKEAISLDVNATDFDQKALQLLSKDKPVFVYCQSGNRSRVAADKLQKLNFLVIYNLNGGYADIKDL